MTGAIGIILLLRTARSFAMVIALTSLAKMASTTKNAIKAFLDYAVP